jgi:hypothetical protein
MAGSWKGETGKGGPVISIMPHHSAQDFVLEFSKLLTPKRWAYDREFSIPIDTLYLDKNPNLYFW